MTFERTSRQTFFGTSALLFASSALLTIGWCRSMATMGAMPMPGGWTMSMAWLPMSGQTWLRAAASFVGMWAAMMVSMMLPSLVPTLWRYRQAIGKTGETSLNWMTALVGAGYFVVWAGFGIVIFPLGAALVEVEMQQPALARVAPVAVAVVVVIAGTLQFSGWKAHHLGYCREPLVHEQRLLANASTAWRQGLHLGLHCTSGCAGFSAILLVLGVMDLRVMALVTAAITAERLAPNGDRVARAIGIIVVGVGLLLVRRAAGLG